MKSPPQEGAGTLRYDHQREGRYALSYDRRARFHTAMALTSSMTAQNDEGVGGRAVREPGTLG